VIISVTYIFKKSSLLKFRYTVFRKILAALLLITASEKGVDATGHAYWLGITGNEDQNYSTIYGQCTVTIKDVINIKCLDQDIGTIRSDDPLGSFSEKVTGNGSDTFRVMPIQKIVNGSAMNISILFQGEVFGSSTNLNFSCSSGINIAKATISRSELFNKHREVSNNMGLTLSLSCDIFNKSCIGECRSSSGSIQSMQDNGKEILISPDNATRRLFRNNSTTVEEIENLILYRENLYIKFFVAPNSTVRRLKCATENSSLELKVGDNFAPELPEVTVSSSSLVNKGFTKGKLEYYKNAFSLNKIILFSGGSFTMIVFVLLAVHLA